MFADKYQFSHLDREKFVALIGVKLKVHLIESFRRVYACGHEVSAHANADRYMFMNGSKSIHIVV